MKNIFGRLLILIFFLTIILISANAQIKNAGDDICKRNYSIYKGFYDNAEYEEALEAWRITLDNCPKISRNIYSHGVKMTKIRLDKETDVVRREQLIDTLFMLYDRRIKYFGDDLKYPEGYILGEKGYDILYYRKDAVDDAYKILSKAIKLQGNKSKPHVILGFMLSTRQLYKMGLIDQANVLDNYAICMDIAEVNLAGKNANGAFRQAKEGIEKHFTGSGAADCESLKELFEPKFRENAEDIELLKKIKVHLIRSKCTESQLFFDVSEALFNLEPSSIAAHNIGKRFLLKEQYNKALEYIEKAISLETDKKNISLYYYELGQLYYIFKADYPKARMYATKSIELNPDWGEPYLLIGKIYVSAYKNFGDNDFEKSTVFWAAVDKFIQAKTIDPKLSKEALKLIDQYSIYFPDAGKIHFQTLKVGDTYTVKGWINEKTKIRARIRPI